MVHFHHPPTNLHPEIHRRILPPLLHPRPRLPLPGHRLPRPLRQRNRRRISKPHRHQSRRRLRYHRRVPRLVQRFRRYRRLVQQVSSPLPPIISLKAPANTPVTVSSSFQSRTSHGPTKAVNAARRSTTTVLALRLPSDQHTHVFCTISHRSWLCVLSH